MANPMTNVAPFEIGLTVSDLKAAISFYRDLLGFTEISRIPTPVEFATKSGIGEHAYTVVRLQLATGERLKLFEPAMSAATRPAGATPLSTVGLAFLTLIVSDITAAVEHARSSKAEVRTDIAILRPGVSVALIADPDGNVVELVEYADVRAYRSDLTSKNALHVSAISE